MVTISLCMIVKNEEAVLERCLKSVKGIADEIIIVDTGSTDATKEIAKKFTEKVYDFEWTDDFSKARNFSFSHAEMDYIMWLDADDVITPENKKKITALKKRLVPEIDIVMMRYDLGGNFHSTRERLVSKKSNPEWQDPIHEYIAVHGGVYQANDIYITHMPEPDKVKDPARNLKVYEKTLETTGTLSPRGKYYYARELKDNGRIRDAIIYFDMFLDEETGWFEDKIAACFNSAICYKILNEPEEAFTELIKSFRYAAPRSEICCMLGYYFKDKDEFNTAIYWFSTALRLPQNEGSGFVLKDYATYVPALELAVCYDKLKMYDKASYYNEIAGNEKPDSPAYLQNKEYFKSILST